MEKVGLAPIYRDVQSLVSGLFSGLHDSLWRIWLYLFLNSFLQARVFVWVMDIFEMHRQIHASPKESPHFSHLIFFVGDPC